jgi:hypothetical protein
MLKFDLTDWKIFYLGLAWNENSVNAAIGGISTGWYRLNLKKCPKQSKKVNIHLNNGRQIKINSIPC